MNRKMIHEEDEDAMVPNEFSDDSQNDMEEFVEHEEQFDVRPSVSSHRESKINCSLRSKFKE